MIGLIPAAGKGKRLGESTNIPKPLLEIKSKTLLQRAIESLVNAGIKKIIIVIGHEKEKIIDFLNSKNFGVDIKTVVQEKQEGLGHAILSAKDLINEIFVVHLLDNIFTENYNHIIKEHLDKKADTTLVYKKEKIKGKNTSLEIKDGQATKILKTPEIFLGCQSVGLYIFEPIIFDYCKKLEKNISGEYELVDAITNLIKDNKKVVGVELKGECFDITTKENLDDANKKLII